MKVVRHWTGDDDTRQWLFTPRSDVVQENSVEHGEFIQESGPFREYHRSISSADGGFDETVEYQLVVPWFRWLFGPVMRRHHRRVRGPTRDRSPGWAPPDVLTPHQVLVLGLLAAASMTSAFVNTLFTQTVAYAGDDFGVGDWGRGVGGTIVRLGIVLAIPLALTADRVGRRNVMVFAAWTAPIVSAFGALAPNFSVLVATQTIGRPIGLALDLLVAVVAAEEMPRNTRAYAVSLLALANGLGASVAVIALPLADVSDGSWRFIYLLGLLWLPVARDLARRLPETRRFEVHREEIEQHHAPPLRRRRLAVQCSVAFFANLIVAPASFFQNAYLKDERGYSGLLVALFTLASGLLGAVGLVIGGRWADRRGRKVLAATCVPFAAVFLALSFGATGALMWGFAMAGGLVAATAYPALAVYRAELFPTGHRSLAGALILASALVGGSIGLLVAGGMLDAGVSHLRTIGSLVIGPVIVSMIVWRTYPETAHRELEDINPEDRFAA